MRLFTQCYQINPERKTEGYIHQCRRILNKQKLSEEAEKSNLKETPEENSSPQTPNQDLDPLLQQENDCKEILEKKDYYEILGISKDADENEIKRAYKKVN